MENEVIKKVRNHHPDRLVLSAAPLRRVEKWLGQLEPQLKGSKLTRTDLVNWLLMSRAEELSVLEIRDMSAKFFDPAKALAWATNLVKEAQKRGEAINLDQILKETLMGGMHPAKTPKVEKKLPANANVDQPHQQTKDNKI